MHEQLRSDAHPTAAGRGRSPGALIAAAIALGALVASAALPGGEAAGAKKRQRPNVVFVRTDDQTVESMRAMSNVNSRLARYGTTFANSFVNLPVCCPSRATFLTGQYAHNHGTLTNSAPRGGFEKFTADHGGNTLPAWLQQAGYYTAQVGKYLNGYGTPANATFVPPGWSEWHAAARAPQSVYDYALNENGTLVEYGSSPADFKQDVFTAKAVDVVNRRAPAKAPFFLTVDYTAPHSGGPNPNPHPPGNCEGTAKPAARHASAFNGEPTPRPPSFDEADVSDKPPDVSERERINANQRQNIARRYRCRMESILSVDEGVSRIVDALKSHGELGRTLILFTSDNGFFHGEHRVPTGKLRHYEPSSRVPLIARGPGFPEGKTVRELAINADLTKTILDAAGVEPGLKQDGRSLAGLAKHPKRERGRELLIETTTYTAIRNARFKYVEHHAGASAGAVELYDLERDPFELQSQHANPAFDALEAQLAARLDALRDCAGSGCRTAPRVKLKVRKRRGCVPRPARVRVKGPDVGRVGRVTFEVGGRSAGKDGSRPFRKKLGKLKRGKKSKVRATVEMLDGRRADLHKRVRACR